jgi:Zn finger protein HypA/HybF involved in hydrogenase expression
MKAPKVPDEMDMTTEDWAYCLDCDRTINADIYGYPSVCPHCGSINVD